MTELEHANITVPDIDSSIRFLQIAAPDFSVRKDGISEQGYRWVHIGNDKSYIALQAAHVGVAANKPHDPYINYGVNHLCLKVDGAVNLEANLRKAGYRQNGPMISETYRHRLYFYDDSGLEWELVEYLSNDPDQMYLYE